LVLHRRRPFRLVVRLPAELLFCSAD
jgi:hypothetical protein